MLITVFRCSQITLTIIFCFFSGCLLAVCCILSVCTSDDIHLFIIPSSKFLSTSPVSQDFTIVLEYSGYQDPDAISYILNEQEVYSTSGLLKQTDNVTFTA